ncbi:hypothetical protein [Longimicrobium sp.]|uniref:hypothetical protein n=1 Tax=Longimicrobium sp. TaxID=2029185 RepID=UPI002E3627AD|nr:hypothetical protein [Longimicrobium sp.]HEX6039639.1 hypothetical protein [Longimicrobium sp.]
MSDTTAHLIVGSEFNAGLYTAAQTIPLSLQGWQIQSLARDPDGRLWCVGSAGNPARWESTLQSWVGAPQLFGGWSLSCLAWDPAGNLWCVGSAGNLSRWLGDWSTSTGRWAGPNDGFPQLASPGGYRSVAFAPDGTPWATRQDGTVTRWSSLQNQWQQQADTLPGGAALTLSFDGGSLYVVTPDFRVFSSSVSTPQTWAPVQTGWTVRWFGPDYTGGIVLPPAA